MSDVEVADAVETATLEQMSDMDIDNVYELMDVQLRERPDPVDLYRRWERQNWSVFDLDFTRDIQDWGRMPTLLKGDLLFSLSGFFLGEAAVTDTLSPLVHAAPTDDDRHFLATQLVDEARHTVFFTRFFREVLGISSIEAAKTSIEPVRVWTSDEGGFGVLFYKHLSDVTDAVRMDPADYGKWVDGIVFYHMLLEGMLALQGQRNILQGARLFGVLPAFRAGFTAVTRDESRHVNYAVYALSKAIEAGHEERVLETIHRYLDATCDVLSKPIRRFPTPTPEDLAELQAFLPAGSTPPQRNLRELLGNPVLQLQKRLRAAGVSAAPLESIATQWWARIEANFDLYEQRFGETHPARVQERTASTIGSAR